MTENLKSICDRLDEISALILTYSAGSGYSTNRLLIENYGGYAPPLSPDQLSWLPKNIANKIREVYTDEDEPDSTMLDHIQTSLNYLTGSLIQAMFTGSAQNAAPAYMATLQYVDSVFDKSLDWQTIRDKNMIPRELARKLNLFDSDLKQLVPKKEELESQIRIIKEAHETADSLPVDLQRLRDANEQVSLLYKQSSELYGSIKDYPRLVKNLFDEIENKNNEAEGLVKQSREAYRITTSIGLAGAFDERASKSELAMWIWVLALVAALVIGALVGGMRVNELIEALKVVRINWGIVVIHSVITLLSFGGPIWFAWLATKQIGQRFRLAEDYAYKASIAKAYEGFRQEATRIDPEFASRLFGSTLTRLDEAPIRLFDTDSYGSPWHELFASKAFQNVLKTAPEFKNELLQIIKEKFPSYGAINKLEKTQNDNQTGHGL